MAPGIHEQTVADFAHFIDAVGELEAAILDMDSRIGVGKITSVHIGDAGHGQRSSSAPEGQVNEDEGPHHLDASGNHSEGCAEHRNDRQA